MTLDELLVLVFGGLSQRRSRFIDGILRCRGPARAIDQVALQADLKALDAKLCKLMRGGGTALWSEHSGGLSHAKRAEGMKAFRIDASMELGKF